LIATWIQVVVITPATLLLAVSVLQDTTVPKEPWHQNLVLITLSMSMKALQIFPTVLPAQLDSNVSGEIRYHKRVQLDTIVLWETLRLILAQIAHTETRREDHILEIVSLAHRVISAMLKESWIISNIPVRQVAFVPAAKEAPYVLVKQ
jgi:hypothetical protein